MDRKMLSDSFISHNRLRLDVSSVTKRLEIARFLTLCGRTHANVTPATNLSRAGAVASEKPLS